MWDLNERLGRDPLAERGVGNGMSAHAGVTVLLARNKTAAYFLSGFRIAFSWLKGARPGSFLKT